MQLSMSMVPTLPTVNTAQFRPRPPSSAPPLTPNAAGLSSAANHLAESQQQDGGKTTSNQQRLWAILAPILVGIALLWVIQVFAHREVLIESYSDVIAQGLLQTKAHMHSFTSQAVTATRAAALHVATQSTASSIGASTADGPLLDTLRALPNIALVFVATATGALSGAGRLSNGTQIVFAVPAAGAALSAWTVTDSGAVRAASPFRMDADYNVTAQAWYDTAMAASSAPMATTDATLWHSTPFMSMATATDPVAAALRRTTFGDGTTAVVGAAINLATMAPPVQRLSIPLLRHAAFANAQAMIVSHTSALVACSFEPCGVTTLAAASNTNALANAALQRALSAHGTLASVPDTPWTNARLYSDAYGAVAVGSGLTQPAWVAVIAVPEDAFIHDRTLEMVLSAAVCGVIAIAVLVTWSKGTLVSVLGRIGFPNQRITTVVAVAALASAVFVLWDATGEPQLDDVAERYTDQLAATVATRLSTALQHPSLAAALAAAAMARGDFNATPAAVATTEGAQRVQKALGDTLDAVSEVDDLTTSLLLGLDSGDLLGASNAPARGRLLVERHAVSASLLRVSHADASWANVGQHEGRPPITFDATAQTWYNTDATMWTPVHTLPVTDHFGVATTVPFAATSLALQQGVIAATVDRRRIATWLTSLVLVASDAVVFVADGPLSALTIVASSTGTSLALNTSTSLAYRIPASASDSTAVATTAEGINTLASSLAATQAAGSAASANLWMGFGLDELAVQVLWPGNTLATPDLNWTAAVAFKAESFRHTEREWFTVALVLAVPVAFATIMLSIVMRPKHDLVSAAAKRWGMARGVLLAAVGRPLPLALEQSLQKRQQQRLERLATRALQAVQSLAVRRRRSVATNQQFWRSRSRTSASFIGTKDWMNSSNQDPEAVLARSIAQPRFSARTEMLRSASHLPPAPGVAIADVPRTASVVSGLHGAPDSGATPTTVATTAEQFLLAPAAHNDASPPRKADAPTAKPSAALHTVHSASVAENSIMTSGDAETGALPESLRPAEEVSGGAAAVTAPVTFQVNCHGGADPLAAIGRLVDTAGTDVLTPRASPAKVGNRGDAFSRPDRGDTMTRLESVMSQVSQVDGETKGAPRRTSTSSPRSLPRSASQATEDGQEAGRQWRQEEEEEEEEEDGVEAIDGSQDVVLASYEHPDSVAALGEQLPSRRQVVECYEQVIAFLDDCTSFDEAQMPDGDVPMAIAAANVAHRRLVMAAVAASDVPSSQAVDLVEVANDLVRQAYSGRNVMHHWYMHISLGSTAARRTVAVSRMLRAAWYRYSVAGVIMCHMLLSFWEGASAASRPSNRTVAMAAQAVFVAVYAVDTVLYYYGYCLSKPLGANLGVHAAFAGSLAEISRRACLRLGFTLAFAADVVIQFMTEYTTGSGSYLPYTSLLRPVFLLSRSSAMRRAISNFASTLLLSRKVILLSLAFITVASVTSIALVTRVGDATSTSIVADTFGTAQAFFINVFVFVSTGENYPDVVYPAEDESSLLVVYYMALEIAGLLILSSLLIAFFQQFYNRLYELSNATRTRRSKTIRHLAIMLAFRVMQLVDKDKVTQAAIGANGLLHSRHRQSRSHMALRHRPSNALTAVQEAASGTRSSHGRHSDSSDLEVKSSSMAPALGLDHRKRPAPLVDAPPMVTISTTVSARDTASPGALAGAAVGASSALAGHTPSTAPPSVVISTCAPSTDDMNSGSKAQRRMQMQMQRQRQVPSSRQLRTKPPPMILAVSERRPQRLPTTQVPKLALPSWLDGDGGESKASISSTASGGSNGPIRKKKSRRPVSLRVNTETEDEAGPHPFRPTQPVAGDHHARILRQISTAAQVLINTHSLATSMSRAMFIRFFASFGIDLAELDRLQYEESQRHGCFRMDASVVAERLHGLSRKGCTSEFLAAMQEFGKRCNGIHAQAMPLELHNRSIYEFIAVCDRRVDPRVEANKRRQLIATQAKSKDMMHHTTSRMCCQRRVYVTLSRSHSCVTVLQHFFDNHARVRFQTLLMIVLALHATAVVLTATTVRSTAVSFLPVFAFLFGGEVLLRLFAEGPNDFWTFYRLEQNEGRLESSYRAQALRFDMLITVAVLGGYIVSKALGLTSGFAEGGDIGILSVPCLRLLSTIETTRSLVFGLVGSLPSFYPLFALLMLMVYDYAIVGVWLFDGMLEQVPGYDIKDANFSTMFNSTATMFQLLIGEAWHEVMLAAVYATSSLTPLYFFCSYIVFVLLIFGNVFTGVICDRFQSMESEERMRLHRMHRERTQIEKSAARTLQKFYFRKIVNARRTGRRGRRASMDRVARVLTAKYGKGLRARRRR